MRTQNDTRANGALEKVFDALDGVIDHAVSFPQSDRDYNSLAIALREYVQAEVRRTLERVVL